MKSVMFYCQHSLGMGHLVRSTELVRALSADFHVTFVTGGKLPDSMPFPAGVEVISLPALQIHPPILCVW